MKVPLEITFTYTRDEYVLAMQRHFKTVVKVWRDLIAGVVTIALGLYLITSGMGWIAWVILVSGLLLLAMVGYAMFLLPRMIYNSQPKLKNEYRLAFSDDGIGFKTEGIDSTLQWSLYRSWLSDADFYIMYHGKRDLTVMPRRALTFDDADRRFREMLENHIGPAMS